MNEISAPPKKKGPGRPSKKDERLSPSKYRCQIYANGAQSMVQFDEIFYTIAIGQKIYTTSDNGYFADNNNCYIILSSCMLAHGFTSELILDDAKYEVSFGFCTYLMNSSYKRYVLAATIEWIPMSKQAILTVVDKKILMPHDKWVCDNPLFGNIEPKSEISNKDKAKRVRSEKSYKEDSDYEEGEKKVKPDAPSSPKIVSKFSVSNKSILPARLPKPTKSEPPEKPVIIIDDKKEVVNTTAEVKSIAENSLVQASIDTLIARYKPVVIQNLELDENVRKAAITNLMNDPKLREESLGHLMKNMEMQKYAVLKLLSSEAFHLEVIEKMKTDAPFRQSMITELQKNAEFSALVVKEIALDAKARDANKLISVIADEKGVIPPEISEAEKNAINQLMSK